LKYWDYVEAYPYNPNMMKIPIRKHSNKPRDNPKEEFKQESMGRIILYGYPIPKNNCLRGSQAISTNLLNGNGNLHSTMITGRGAGAVFEPTPEENIDSSYSQDQLYLMRKQVFASENQLKIFSAVFQGHSRLQKVSGDTHSQQIYNQPQMTTYIPVA